MAYDEKKLKANLMVALNEFVPKEGMMPGTLEAVAEGTVGGALVMLRLICGDPDSPMRPRGIIQGVSPIENLRTSVRD